MIDKICRFIYSRLLGWRIEGNPPRDAKYIFVVLPHTSNWDFVIGWMASRSIGLHLTIFAKDEFFVWPLTYFCRFFGVEPVNRRESTNFVDSIARQFGEREVLRAVITPEGTRKKVEDIKSGYYYLAVQANVPIVLAAPDYKRKAFVVTEARPAFADFVEDRAQALEFAATITAHDPQKTFDN